nr:Chain P, upain-1 W3A [synthetic construct]4ZKN_P Chain P, upain-1-W3A [synthetic construct]4ZKR_P Chain P, upain-1-W3A [synthetic construct]
CSARGLENHRMC